MIFGISKKMLLLYALLVCYINNALSGITTTPGMQRKSLGETATFQWSVTGSLSSYVVNNLQSMTLSANANYTLDSQNAVVTLIIRYLQLSDAGNYSLSVTTGTTTQTDAGALLFVYGSSTTFVNQTSGGSSQLPATEGDAIELTCTTIPTSLPVAYRPRIYYRWQLLWFGVLQNISSGPATSLDFGDSVPGYSIKDYGKTLVIASAQYRDLQSIYCYGQEQWSPYSPYQYGSPLFNLPLKYRPYITSRTLDSRKSNPIVGNSVTYLFYYMSVPAVTSATNWSFINTAGVAQDLPAEFSFSNSFSAFSLAFTFNSEAYYGNYSITLSNTIGATTETFQVLRPGLPDAPSSVKVDFVSHYLIAIAWNCMWFNGRQQTTFLQLKDLYNDSVIDSGNTTVSTACYNYTSITQFQNGIQPETDYEVRIWSTNNLGSSDVVKLTVKTTKIFKFFVSPKTISLNGNQAIVNFSSTEGKIARLYVTYCLELTGNCQSNNYYNPAGQIIYNSIQSGDVYVFDFMVYGGNPRRYTYFLAMVKGVRVSRNGDAEEPDGEKASPLLIAVIVLGVLLGIAVLALIGCLIAFLVSKRRQNTQPNSSQQTQQPKVTAKARAPQPTTERNNQAYEEDDTYEAVDGDPSKDDTYYTALEGQRYG